MAPKKISRRAAAAAAFDADLAAEVAGAAGQPAAAAAPTPAATAGTPAVAPVAPAPAAAVPAPVDWEARARQAESDREADRLAADTRFDQFRTQAESDRAETQRQLADLQTETKTERDLRVAHEAKLRLIEQEKAFEVDFSGMEHLSAEAARELTEKVIKPVTARIRAEYDQRLEGLNTQEKEREARYSSNFSKIEESTATAARARTNRRIVAAHADFQTITATQAFTEFKSSRIPGTRTTWGAEMAKAYADGDADYVNEAVTSFKAQHTAPTLAAVAGAPAGGAPTTVASQPATAEQKYSYGDLDKWRSQRRRGEITRAQELALTKAFRAAEVAGNVT